jgi:hypothetical protein
VAEQVFRSPSAATEGYERQDTQGMARDNAYFYAAMPD